MAAKYVCVVWDKISKMFCGPMWSHEPTCQAAVITGKGRDPLKVERAREVYILVQTVLCCRVSHT